MMSARARFCPIPDCPFLASAKRIMCHWHWSQLSVEDQSRYASGRYSAAQAMAIAETHEVPERWYQPTSATATQPNGGDVAKEGKP